MPQDVSPDVDKRSIDQIIEQMLTQEALAKFPRRPDGTLDVGAHAQQNKTGRRPPDDAFPPEAVEGGTDTIDRNYY